jgi:hypothetical protein
MSASGRIFTVFHGLLGILYLYTIALLVLDSAVEIRILQPTIDTYLRAYNKVRLFIFDYKRYSYLIS